MKISRFLEEICLSIGIASKSTVLRLATFVVESVAVAQHVGFVAALERRIEHQENTMKTKKSMHENGRYYAVYVQPGEWAVYENNGEFFANVSGIRWPADIWDKVHELEAIFAQRAVA